MRGRGLGATVTAALALGLVASGCEQSTEELVRTADATAARATVEAFGSAVKRKDYRALCDRILAPELLRGLGAGPVQGLSCPTALAQGLGSLVAPTLTVQSVTISPGGRAAVVVRTTASGQPPSTDQLGLVKAGVRWQIVTLTAPPSGAPPSPAPPRTAPRRKAPPRKAAPRKAPPRKAAPRKAAPRKAAPSGPPTRTAPSPTAPPSGPPTQTGHSRTAPPSGPPTQTAPTRTAPP